MELRTIVSAGIAAGMFGFIGSTTGLIVSIFTPSCGHWLFWVTLQLLSVGIFLATLTQAIAEQADELAHAENWD